MALKYLENRQRRQAQKIVQTVSWRFIKDAIITQMQPMINQEILDVELGANVDEDCVKTTLYLKKGQSRTRKDSG